MMKILNVICVPTESVVLIYNCWGTLIIVVSRAMVSFRSVMNKVAPKLAAINQFTRQIDKHDQTGKKVKFDLATVSFQVS